MTGGWQALVGDALLVLGLLLVTLAVIAVLRLPDVYMKLHGAGKATSLGIAFLALATIPIGEPGIFLRALLVATFVVLTAPVSAHAIARAAFHRSEPMRWPDSIDESGRGLVEDPERDRPTGEAGR